MTTISRTNNLSWNADCSHQRPCLQHARWLNTRWFNGKLLQVNCRLARMIVTTDEHVRAETREHNHTGCGWHKLYLIVGAYLYALYMYPIFSLHLGVCSICRHLPTNEVIKAGMPRVKHNNDGKASPRVTVLCQPLKHSVSMSEIQYP